MITLARIVSGGQTGKIAAGAIEFVMTNKIATLNVAGPRESNHGGAAEYARQEVTRLIAPANHTA